MLARQQAVRVLASRDHDLRAFFTDPREAEDWILSDRAPIAA
ncbi:hypothetical protein AB5I41_21110 [Sphingomonas sp. MMS24-JH45]